MGLRKMEDYQIRNVITDILLVARQIDLKEMSILQNRIKVKVTQIEK